MQLVACNTLTVSLLVETCYCVFSWIYNKALWSASTLECGHLLPYISHKLDRHLRVCIGVVSTYIVHYLTWSSVPWLD